MLKLGIIGAGNMATAISRGILRQETFKPSEMMIFDINAEQLRPFAALGMQIAATEAQVVENCHYVLLAVKPQVYRVVLAKIAPVCRPDSVFISIAAGISGERIKKELGYDAKVIQVMPNTPVLVGCGASALSCFAPATQEEFEQVQSIFAASGYAVQIKPEQMNDVIPINGSSPAIFYYIAQIVVERAVELGFDKDVANNLICQAMIGSAKMMLESGKSHQELIDMVSSKGGTTLAMSAAMKDHQFKEALLAGVDACIRRACELGE